MEHFIETLKYVSAVIAVFAPALKLFPGYLTKRPRMLDEQYRRIKAFFDEGGVERHPLLVEASFAAAMGHRKLNATEIRLLLGQRNPMKFMDVYMRVQDYLGTSETGDKFELRSFAARKRWRQVLMFTGIALYALLSSAVLWLAFYLLPRQVFLQPWSSVIATLSIILFFAAMAAYCLVSASRLHWAKQLHEAQT